MNRRSAIGGLAGFLAFFSARRVSSQPAMRLRVFTGGDRNAAMWRVHDIDSGQEITRDIPARWATKFAKAKIGEPFHFTRFGRTPDGRLLVGGGRVVQKRVRAIIAEKA
jgi:hypothetical protein